MIYYKTLQTNGIDFSLAIPTSVYGFEDFIFFTLLNKVENEMYIEITKEEFESELLNRIVEEEEVTEPTQLDRIEAKLEKSNQDIIDEYTLQLIESGVIA